MIASEPADRSVARREELSRSGECFTWGASRVSVVAEFSIRADEFLLGEVIAAFPGLSVEIERVVPAEKRVMPYVWAYGADLAAFEAAMDDHPNVREITALDRFDDRALYRIDWEDPAEELVTGIAETDATVLEAYSDDEWTFRIRFEDHSGLASFNRYSETHGITYRLERVSALADAPGVEPHGLTPEQHEALRLAVEAGYFEVPRQVTFEELAGELGVSVQALSERVRRGADTVLRAALLERGPDA